MRDEGYLPASIEAKLDAYRCLFISEHDPPGDREAFPFSIPERETKGAHIFGVADNTLVYRWCRDNLTNPWAMTFEEVTDIMEIDGVEDTFVMQEIVFLFQTEEDATHFRLRF